MKTNILICVIVLSLVGCMPAEIKGRKPDGSVIEIKYYPGGSVLDDVIILNNATYFGKANYQIDDELADIGFRFLDGKRVRAECITTTKDIIGNTVCKEYKVFKSSFKLIPEGTVILSPSVF